MLSRVCGVCGGGFVPRVSGARQVYCCGACYGVAESRRARGRRAAARPGRRLGLAAWLAAGDVGRWVGVLRLDPCVYCGGPGGTIEHVVPRVRGGGDVVENLAGACRSCNSAKQDMGLLAFLACRGLRAERREWLEVGRGAA